MSYEKDKGIFIYLISNQEFLKMMDNPLLLDFEIPKDFKNKDLFFVYFNSIYSDDYDEENVMNSEEDDGFDLDDEEEDEEEDDEDDDEENDEEGDEVIDSDSDIKFEKSQSEILIEEGTN